MLKDAFTAPYLCTDATGVLVQAKEQCRRAHFWVLIAPERHVLYRYTHAHNSAAVDVLLAGYKGYLVADAATVYDHLYKNGDVVEVACWAHTRRYFFKALGSEPELAKHALALIKGLFRIERAIQTAPRKKREQIRREQSRPILDAFFQWCDEQALVALDETPSGRTQRTPEALGLVVGDFDAAARVAGTAAEPGQEGRIRHNDRASARSPCRSCPDALAGPLVLLASRRSSALASAGELPQSSNPVTTRRGEYVRWIRASQAPSANADPGPRAADAL